MDITSLVTLPVWIMEPYTMLQKVAEIMEYTELLDTAASTQDEYERSEHSLPDYWPQCQMLSARISLIALPIPLAQ